MVSEGNAALASDGQSLPGRAASTTCRSLETEHGCWLSGYRLGGWGWLFRVGGMLRDDDSRPVIASVIATLARLYRHSACGGKRVAVPPELAGKPPATLAGPPRQIGIVTTRPTAAARRTPDLSPNAG